MGEGRACWSLGNAHSAMSQHKEAYHFAVRHLQISRETGDRMGQATAQLNIAELSRILGYPEGSHLQLPPLTVKLPVQQQLQRQHQGCVDKELESYSQRRESMEQLDLMKMTSDDKRDGDDSLHNHSGFLDEEEFFDFISRFQSKRMDDQRCSLNVCSISNPSDTPSRNNRLKFFTFHI